MSVIRFPPFVLDRDAATLQCDGEPVHLRPRTWDVLCYLVERAGRLVTKDDLLDAVWSDAVVSEGTLTNSIRELRLALNDDARSPRFIETVHRRGFRFVADVARTGGEQAPAEGRHAIPRAPSRQAGPGFVARDAELRELAALAARAADGATLVVLLRGEAGIGKSSLVERLVALIDGSQAFDGMRTAVGRAIGYSQGAPPFLPIVSAIEQLATGESGAAVVGALRTHAPDLLAQMPWLDPGSAADSPEARRRELAVRLTDLFAALTEQFPIVLVLEDLHDADASTVDFLAALLEKSRIRRLLVVATYRPGEAVLASNGIAEAAARIQALDGGSAVDLELLGHDDVAAYLRARDASFWNDQLASSVHRRSGGNPLFMVTVADTIELMGERVADVAAIPDSLRGLLETQLRTLEFGEREMLMAASAVGVEFSSLALAAATGRGLDEIEDVCETLARQGRFLKTTGVADWPSGAVGQAYAFRHDLYRQALYAALPAARRAGLHQRIGESLEAGHAGQTLEVASQLADQFSLAGDAARAVVYLREAARLARERSVHRESLDLLDRALALAARFAEENEREQAEFAIQAERAVSAGTLYGYGTALSKQASERVALLGARLPASYERFFSLMVVFSYQIIRSDLAAASALTEQMTRMADALDLQLLRHGALSASSIAASARGDFEQADHGLRAYLADISRDFRVSNFRDIVCPSLAVMSQNLCYLDRRAEAEKVAAEAVERSDWLGDEFERANARATSAYCAALYGDRAQTFPWALEVDRISREHEIEETAAIAEVLLAWSDEAAGLDARRARVANGIRGLERSGRLLGTPFYLSLLAELEMEAGDFVAAVSTLARAREFCESTGSRRHLAELCRLTAHAESKLAARGGAARARDWLAEARRIAERQACALTLRRLEEGSSRRRPAS